jgi:hypothetical protein
MSRLHFRRGGEPRIQMATYEYALLIGRDEAGPGGGVTWHLNGIGQRFDVRTEIILMREGS